MRGFLTSSLGAPSTTASSIGVSATAVSAIGVACAAVLALPLLSLPAVAAPAAHAAPARPSEAGVPGSTRSLPLVPLSRERVLGAAPVQGLYRPSGEHFSLVGVVWNDPGTELHGRVQVRTRSARTGEWSGWQDVETHNADHGADPGTAERRARRLRGATAPLWVGGSEGVDVRVRGVDGGARGGRSGGRGARGSRTDGGRARDSGIGDGGARDSRTVGGGEHGGRTVEAGRPHPPLPSGLRLELVDPGDEAPPEGASAGAPRTWPLTGAARAASAANTDLAGFGALEIPALDKRATERELARLAGPVRSKPYIGPRPRIVTRRGWDADESLREGGFVYAKKVKVAFVHHTASGNTYTCAQAPSVVRSIYRYHVASMGWGDIGYNFLVDKCGTIYEGRAGGVAKAVLGAHTLGFNNNSMGIAVIGSYGATKPPAAAVTAVARLTAWKLGLFGADPRGKTYLTSGGGNLYPKGKNVRLNVISGHRDGFATECPGKRLYARLGTARSGAARYQGR
ncbi:peptidoglycan recognition protein [Streptomyces sp. RB17]|uniref:peptidoglycan recognition protein family protein n=1 Tax=Streptomyces sp. RB17 TaxID=2585197 RepID=UPI003A4C5F32